MARIPRTKSRPITVDDVQYRWMVKDARWRYGGSAKTMRLVIQNEADRPGNPLLATLTSKNWSQGNAEEWDFVHRAALTPGDVATVIRTALGRGWKPEKHSGRPFAFDETLDLKEYAIRPPPPPPKPLWTWYEYLMAD
jgi:hypothetical protein